MKNLEKYIKENKEELESYSPSESVWKNVDSIINKKKNKRKKWWIYSSVASVILIVGLMIPKMEKSSDDNLAYNPHANFASERNKSEFKPEIEWASQKEVDYKFRNKEKNIELNSNMNGTFSVDGLQGSSVYLNKISTISVQDISIGATSACKIVKKENEVSYNWSTDETILMDTTLTTVVGKKEIKEDPRAKSYYYYEQYDDFKENTFESPIEKPLSTFGIDVDNAAYSNSRRFINDGYLPPKNAVKLEEFINYFDYNLPQPKDRNPFSITTELADCPWQKDNLLMQVAIQGERIERDEQKPNNLVFLLDVSGSMDMSNKLPLLKKSLKLLVKEMREEDRIAIVVYAGASGLVLPSTSGNEKEKIWAALENLNAGGGTAGGEGIELAYKTALKSFKKEGNNRIILATDGDFNIGISDDDALIKLIEEKRKSGVFISVIGFGNDNFESSKMEKIADNGNGNFYYIDNILEAKKVLVTEMGGTLITIAKDVKLQLEFNPEYVKSYRLLGYENRMLETKDFEDDKKDAGDLGSGHSVIALYEIVPRDKDDKSGDVSNLRYQKKVVNESKNLQDEFAMIKFRYKKPKSSKSTLIEHIVTNKIDEKPSAVFQFSTAVTEFGLLLRESNYRGNASYSSVLKRARANKGVDKNGYRAEFIQLVEKSKLMFEEYWVREE